MPKLKIHNLAAIAAIAPFLLGFSPPQESGTHVSASAGAGRALYSPGCARPRLVEYTDQQAGVYHRTRPMGRLDTRLGVGADINRYASREKECTEEQCANTIPAWEERSDLFFATPSATLDWKWAGMGAGLHIPLGRDWKNPTDRENFGSWMDIPFKYSLRLGQADRLYFSVEVGNGLPAKSGAAGGQFGMGGRIRDTEIWLGAHELGRDAGPTGRIGQNIGPFRLRLAGTLSRLKDRYTEDEPDDLPEEDRAFRIDLRGYSYSAGLDYTLPW